MLDRPPSSTPPDPGAATGTRVVVLANPYSGTGPNRRRVDAFTKALIERGFEPQVCWTPEERRQTVAEADDVRCAVVAGGDGSIADAVNELEAAGALDRVPVATLPLGNENLFADEFGFNRGLAKLAEAIAAGRDRRIDLGRVGDRLFTLMASAGLDADVVHRMARWRTGRRTAASDAPPGSGTTAPLRRVNRLSYAKRLLGSLQEYPYPELTLQTDDGEVTGSHVFVFNLPRYGGGLGIAPEARADDGRLDYVVFRRPGMIRLAAYALGVVRGRHLAREDVAHGRSRSARISAAGPADPAAPIQADGDPAGATPATVAAVPGALRVVCTDAAARSHSR